MEPGCLGHSTWRRCDLIRDLQRLAFLTPSQTSTPQGDSREPWDSACPLQIAFGPWSGKSGKSVMLESGHESLFILPPYLFPCSF